MSNPQNSTQQLAHPTQPFRPSIRRRRFVVDRQAQSIYLIFVLLLACVFTVVNIITTVLWHIMVGSAEMAPSVPISTLVITIIAIACVGILAILIAIFAANYVSNLLAGPVWKLNENMKKVLEFNQIEELGFRKMDQFHEVAKNYNLLLEKFKTLQAEVSVLRQAATKVSGKKPGAE